MINRNCYDIILKRNDSYLKEPDIVNNFFKVLTPIVLLIFLAACSNEEGGNQEADDNIEIYTTVFPLKSFAEQIGGDSVDASTIYPKGVDVHTYEPTQKEMIDFAEGDLFIYTSDAFDPVADSIKNAVGEHSEFLPAADNIAEDDLMAHDHEHDAHEEHDHEHEGHDHGSTDPHVWLDPVLAQSMAEQIKDKLIELNPDEASTYEENYETLAADLADLDAEFNQLTADPLRESVYISHESIGYLADRYHFEQVAINGLNNDTPSQQDLTDIVDSIEEQNIKYILHEQNVTSSITDTIQSSTDTEPLEFHNLSVLTDEDDEGSTYQSIMRENISVLDKALND